jgi:hypothetical protein
MSNDKPDYPPIRRVITGHDDAHVAKVLVDAPATNAKYPSAGTVSTLIWCTEDAPAAVPVGEAPEDMGARILGTAPPPKGHPVRRDRFPARQRGAYAPHGNH